MNGLEEFTHGDYSQNDYDELHRQDEVLSQRDIQPVLERGHHFGNEETGGKPRSKSKSKKCPSCGKSPCKCGKSGGCPCDGGKSGGKTGGGRRRTKSKSKKRSKSKGKK